MPRLHLDHNATTPLRPEARAVFLRELDRLGGNPSSVHASGRAARVVLDLAREQTAAALGVHEDEIVFTSGGTESIHLAVLGCLRAAPSGLGLVTTQVEHSAGLGAAELAEAAGRPVVRMGVDAAGRLELDELRRRHAGDLALVSIQTANNEVGTVHPVPRIVELLRARPDRPLFHTDAVQALGRVPLRLGESGVDLASFSAHKLGGPLGVGILYRRKGVRLAPLFQGGGQEAGLRPGTENVPAIAAAACAVELAVAETTPQAASWRALTAELWHQLHLRIPDVRLNGPAIDADDRLPNTLNVSLPSTDACSSRASTSKDSRSAPAPHARADRSNLRTFCSRWAARATTRARVCGSRSVERRVEKMSTTRWRSCRESGTTRAKRASSTTLAPST
ncbi:MAG: aminotransferase class V-fold PLP-dependent enzyme [Planctomycetes bacterium]|nr:aminotransferase class V-fold PLP-dependent enzyme [Planctomycetota bacterium]